MASNHPLEYIFHPRHVAIAGASQSGGGMGGGFLPSIVEMGFKGPIYPVNPRYDEVHGLQCYPSLRDCPTDVDYVISSVPAAVVPGLVEDCAAKHVKVIHFFTAGFSETGDELVSVLRDSFDEVIGHADVQRPRGATHDVDVIVARHGARGRD